MAWALTAVLAVAVIGLVAVILRQRSQAGATVRLQAEAAGISAPVAQAEADRAQAEADRTQAEADRAQTEADRDAAQERATALEAEVATAQERATALEAEVDTAARARDAAQAQAAALQAELGTGHRSRDTAQAEAAGLRSELDAAGSNAATLERDLQSTRSARRAAETRVTTLEAELQATRSARTAAEARVAGLQIELESARSAPADPSTEAATPDGAPPAATGPGPVGQVPGLDDEAVPPGGQVRGGPGGAGDPRLAAVWALAELAQRRAWRLSLAAPDEPQADGLGGALTMEVERIREEVGTPGTLQTSLEPAVAVDDATLALLGARELLATLAPHTQAFDMTVRRQGDHLAITVVCTGWDGPSNAADDVGRLLAAVAPAGADLQLDADAAGRLQATLQLPLLG